MNTPFGEVRYVCVAFLGADVYKDEYDRQWSVFDQVVGVYEDIDEAWREAEQHVKAVVYTVPYNRG